MSLKIQAFQATNIALSNTAKNPQTGQAVPLNIAPDSFQAPAIRFASETPLPYTYTPDKNILADLKKRAEEDPDRIAFAEDASFGEPGQIAVKLTNRELYENALRIGRALKEEFKLKPGDRIGAIETNSPEYIQLFFGSLAAGVSMAAINTLALADPKTSGSKLMYMVGEANLKALFVGADPLFQSFEKLKPAQCDLVNDTYKGTNVFFKYCPKPISTFIPALKKARQKLENNLALKTFMLNRCENGMRIITTNSRDNLQALLKYAPLDEKDANLNAPPDQEALMLYTSGTTANPKPVPIKHKSLVHLVESLKEKVGAQLSPDDKFYMALPLFHIFGKGVFLLGLSEKVKMTVLRSLRDGNKNPEKMLATIQREKVTVFPIIPGILQKLAENKMFSTLIQSLRFVVSGGSKMPKDLHKKMEEANPGTKIWEGYGMTETSIITLNTTGEYGHVGKPISPYVQIDLREKTLEGTGEVWVHSPGNSTEYVGGTPEQNSEMFKGNGLCKTEDLGTYDEQGNLKVSRAALNIKRSGEKCALEDFDTPLTEFLDIKKAITIPRLVKGKNDEIDEQALSLVLIAPKSTGDAQSFMAILKKKAKDKEMLPRFLPDFILPIKGESFPASFMSANGKPDHKAVIAYAKQLEADGVIKLGKTLEILKPEVLGLDPSGTVKPKAGGWSKWLNPLNLLKRS